MKAITLTQPWATLVALGAKRIETRSWSTHHRGVIAVHAAKGWSERDRALCARAPFRPALASGGYTRPDQLPRGCVVATATLADVCRIEGLAESSSVLAVALRGRSALVLPPAEYYFGDFRAGRFAWMLEEVVMITPPVPTQGALGLWDWRPEPGTYTFSRPPAMRW